MNIGITCYPTHGGSGVIATELGLALAQRGHEVHFISYSVPFRLNRFYQNVFFHEVDVTTYPLFKYPPYDLNLATLIANVATERKLELIHAHYAVPHAVSAYLAKKMLRHDDLRVVTTLHGTDITLVGADHSFHQIVKFSIEESDGVTAVSRYLKQKTIEEFGIERDIRVIYNFVDTTKFTGTSTVCHRHQFAPDNEKVVMHASNFRPVKRVGDVIRIFARVREALPAKLILVGEGPERMLAQQLVEELKLISDVYFLCQQDYIENVLSCADLFLLPSEQESFGLAALEAMSCGVPVIATQSGGLPEVIVDSHTGFLFPVGEVQAMATQAIELLRNEALLTQFKRAAQTRAREVFDLNLIVPQYEDFYQEILSK